jgi:dihydrofolate synthase/folylpolyglutamate synthase
MSHRDYLLSLEHLGIKLGLAQIRALVAALGHPDRAFRSVVVAGTNGKGSVTAMIERGLRAAGVATGRFTSPHLVSLNERFSVRGADIDDAALESVAGTVRDAAAALPQPPSFFEATTALALEWFRREGVEIAVLEVGLGGRLDATNVVTPVVAVITNVDFDHKAHLGSTLPAIAAEKAGIITPGAVAVLGPNPPEVEAVVRAACASADAQLVLAALSVPPVEGTTADGRTYADVVTPVRAYRALTPSLRGRHQLDNSVTAVRVLEELDRAGHANMTAEAIRAGVEDVSWPGRLQLVSWRGHDVLVDGAHNPAGACALADFVTRTYGRRLPFVVGIMSDKEIDRMLTAFGRAASLFVFTAAASPRAAAPAMLLARATAGVPRVPATVAADPVTALGLACAEGELVVVAGSLFLAGDVLANLT